MAAQQNAEGANWPSHARRPRTGEDDHEDGPAVNVRNVRGVVKGLKATKKRLASKSRKLQIEFSGRLGGAIGVNRRSFIDEVVVQMRQYAPLIGIETWSKVPKDRRDNIVEKVLDHWELKDDEKNRTKILTIAGERYKTWRSNLAATYRAYATDEERLKHKPEELSMDEWKHLIYYFGTDKFQGHWQNLGNQAEQVYYVKDIKNPNWCMVVRTKPRNLYAMPTRDVAETEERSDDGAGDIVNWSRDDIARVSVNEDVASCIVREQDANVSSSDSESDTNSDSLIYFDDDSILG